MREVIILLSIFLIMPFKSVFPVFEPVYGLESVQIKRAVISSFNPSLVWVASRNSLYRSQDRGKTFKKVSVFKDEEVKHIFFDPKLASTLYVAASRHLYKINIGEEEEKLKQLFFSSEDQMINTAAKHKGVLFIGTDEGVHFASEDVLIWSRLGSMADSPVYCLEPAGEDLYLATGKGVHVFKTKDKIEKLFVIREEETEEEGEGEDEEDEEEENQEGLTARVIKVDIFDKDQIWLGTNRGLFVSQDKGSNWRKLYLAGINNLSINCLFQTSLQKNALYLGTTKGFFRVNLRKNESKQIFEGLHSSYIHWGEFTPEGEIYLATSKGLFRNVYFTPSYHSNSLKVILRKEPSIQEVQQAALHCNEVHPDKIKKWRSALKYRALFPEISLDYDKTIYGAYGASYRGAIVGPKDWGVNFKWKVGDLIWNSYEDDIDTKGRLNTRLRLDILDEINRVYFERLRLRREIVDSSLSEEELFAKELRLRELTAILDGYTGGFFSEKTKELSSP